MLNPPGLSGEPFRSSVCRILFWETIDRNKKPRSPEEPWGLWKQSGRRDSNPRP